MSMDFQAMIDAMNDSQARTRGEYHLNYGSWEEGHRNVGWNNCLEDYEQNLLKELEEV